LKPKGTKVCGLFSWLFVKLNGDGGDDDLMDVNNEESDEEEEVEVPTLTLIQLKKWQRALLEVRFTCLSITNSKS
jgi:hypothetical protein